MADDTDYSNPDNYRSRKIRELTVPGLGALEFRRLPYGEDTEAIGVRFVTGYYKARELGLGEAFPYLAWVVGNLDRGYVLTTGGYCERRLHLPALSRTPARFEQLSDAQPWLELIGRAYMAALDSAAYQTAHSIELDDAPAPAGAR
jgi:hypothetical protein